MVEASIRWETCEEKAREKAGSPPSQAGGQKAGKKGKSVDSAYSRVHSAGEGQAGNPAGGSCGVKISCTHAIYSVPSGLPPRTFLRATVLHCRLEYRPMAVALTPAQWAAYDEDGFVVVDNLVPEADLIALNTRLDDIMMGRVQYGEALLMQLDPSAKAAGSGTADEYAAYAAAGAERGQTPGFKGPSLAYRKIGEAQAGLECDPVFLEFMRRPFFRSLCDRVYGAHAAISVYRAMVMSKPAGGDGGGTPLPWREYSSRIEGVRATLTVPPMSPPPRRRPGRRRLVGAR